MKTGFIPMATVIIFLACFISSCDARATRYLVLEETAFCNPCLVKLKTEIFKEFGEPYSLSFTASGVETWDYRYEKRSGKGL